MIKNNHLYKNILISCNKEYQRIDNFLFSQLKNVSKNLIYRFIRTGIIRINKKRIQPKYKLQYGDIVNLPKCLQKDTLKKKLDFLFKK